MILKVGLPSLNLSFSGPDGSNVIISVPIRKRILKLTLYLIVVQFLWELQLLKHENIYFWETLYVAKLFAVAICVHLLCCTWCVTQRLRPLLNRAIATITWSYLTFMYSRVSFRKLAQKLHIFGEKKQPRKMRPTWLPPLENGIIKITL